MDDINYENLMIRIEKFYDTDDSGHDYRLKYAKELITRWIEKGSLEKLGNSRTVYELMIQLDLRGY